MSSKAWRRPGTWCPGRRWSRPIRTIDQLKSNPALAHLKAVQNERFVVVTLPEVFAGARVADTVEKFAKGFHPDRF